MMKAHWARMKLDGRGQDLLIGGQLLLYHKHMDVLWGHLVFLEEGQGLGNKYLLSGQGGDEEDRHKKKAGGRVFNWFLGRTPHVLLKEHFFFFSSVISKIKHTSKWLAVLCNL